MARSIDSTLAQAKPDTSQMAANKVSPFRSDIIEVLVGPSAQRYHVHRDKICAVSPFFRQCLQANMVESSSKTVRLPEDSPDAFEVILNWTYSGTVPHLRRDDRSQLELLIKTYYLADKLCMEDCANQIMDDVKERHHSCYTYASFITQISSSPMRDYLKQCVSWEIANPRHSIWIDPEGSQTEEYADFFRGGGEIVTEVMLRSVELIQGLHEGIDSFDKATPWDKADCDFHRHVDTKPCTAKGKS